MRGFILALIYIGIIGLLGGMDLPKELTDPTSSPLEGGSSDAVGTGDMVFKLQNENRQLRIENVILRKSDDRMRELDAKIEELKSEGYIPQRLMVYHILSRARAWNVSQQFAFQVLKTESSLWVNLNGQAKEFGGFQILPATLKFHLASEFGIDTTNIDLRPYASLKTNTEWAFYLFKEMQYNRGRLTWEDWNRGFEPIASTGGN